MHSECSYCLSVHVCACLFVRTHAGIQTEHTCLNGCITHKNAAPEMYLRTCMYSCVRTSDLSLKIEEDVDGAIEMMAQTGPFSVPVRCRRKRCAVSGYLNVHTYIQAVRVRMCKHSLTLLGFGGNTTVVYRITTSM